MSGAQAVCGEKLTRSVLNEATARQHVIWARIMSGCSAAKPEDRMIEDYATVMAETIRQHSEGGAVPLP